MPRAGSLCITHAAFYVLTSFRSRSEYVQQLVSDIASYYGYNDYLAEKLFQLFPVAEVRTIVLYEGM